MRAGRLRHVLKYQTRSDVDDAYGQGRPVWATTHTWRAEVTTPNGRELVLAEQIQAVAEKVIRIRHPGFIPAANARLVEVPGDLVYQITAAVDPDGYRRQVLIFAKHNPAETTP